MKILAYCYGPFSTKKDSYCNQFVEENTDYSLICCHKIREKISGNKFIKDKLVEAQVRDQVSDQCLKILNKKNKNVIVNGLFLNEEGRLNLIDSVEKKFDDKIKKVAIAFLPTSATSTYESLKSTKEFKDIDFEDLRKQFFNFKLAKKQEEGDVLINKIENYGEKFHLETQLWGREEIISCNNLKKVSEYIKFTSSFAN
jgi:hypothetical protein